MNNSYLYACEKRPSSLFDPKDPRLLRRYVARFQVKENSNLITSAKYLNTQKRTYSPPRRHFSGTFSGGSQSFSHFLDGVLLTQRAKSIMILKIISDCNLI